MASEPDRINDIFQDLFILLRRDDFRKLKSYKAKNGCSLASWLRTVVVNFTIDHLRKIKRTVSIDAEDELELSLKDILADDSAIASEMLIEQEKFAVLKDCIELLDGDSKLFVNLSINRGVSPDELSEIFKVSRGAIDMRKLRIIDKLKECFKNKGFLR
jgi:RNA polymerase sigma factor (sigma-70 family)